MSLIDRLDAFQRRHPVIGFPLAVIYKFFDDAGGYLAALLTYFAFVSLFPLLLLFATALSFVLRNDPELQQKILDSALSQLPVIGAQLGDPKSLSGGLAGIIVGVIVSGYGALGVGNALQYAMNTIWGIPRNERPNPFLIRGRSALLVVTAGVAILATTVVSTIGGTTTAFQSWTRILIVALTIVVNTGIVYLAYRLGVRWPSRFDLLPGALFVAVVWQVLQTYGVALVGRVVRDASASNSVFGFVLGLLAFIYVAAVSVVLGAELSIVRARKLYPRALLTPFTDNVDLTDADVEAYRRQARTMRSKGYQRIEVSFPEDTTEESATEPKG